MRRCLQALGVLVNNFVWVPGVGCDPAALSRLQQHFLCPSEPMGEAWFMGSERETYLYLLGNLNTVSVQMLQKPLEEIASGTMAFGARDEWRSWYHYLLGALLPRSHETYLDPLLEYLMSGFMSHYPNGIESEPYRGFHADALATLGRCIMDGSCWQDSNIVVGKLLHRSNNNPNKVWCWWDASGDFSSSMFFCLKYLPKPAISAWLRSVIRIESAHWQAQLIVWLVGAYDILSGRIQWPSQFLEKDGPSIGWAWSHSLRAEGASPGKGQFIPEHNRQLALEVFHEELTEERYIGWLTSIDGVDYLKSELGDVPDQFERLYLRATNT